MRRSDEARFTAFVEDHSATLFRTAYLMTGDYQRAEDILQTVLVRVYQRWGRVEVMGRPVGYARKVLVNETVSWWRRRSSREAPTALLNDPSWAGGIDQVAEHERVWRAVLSLPPRQRAVTVLKYYEDLSEAEIAATLEMARGTVKSHSHAAARRLAFLLGEPSTQPAGPGKEATS